MTQAMRDVEGDDLLPEQVEPGPHGEAHPASDGPDAAWSRLRALQAALPPGLALVDHPLEWGHRWRLIQGLDVLDRGLVESLTGAVERSLQARLQAAEPPRQIVPRVTALGLRFPGYLVVDDTRAGQVKVLSPLGEVIGRTGRGSSARRGGASAQRRVAMDAMVRQAQEAIAAQHV